MFGSQGFVDFWISNTTGWAIELLRNGDRSAQHAERFGNEGIYSGVPMSAFALIDFRQGQTSKVVVRPGFWYIAFDPDFSRATITTREEGQDSLSVTVCNLSP